MNRHDIEHGIYIPECDLFFPIDEIPGVLRDYLLSHHSRIIDPPYRNGGYRIASIAVCRRMLLALIIK